MPINSCTFMGNLTRDCDVRQTQSGTSVYNFSIAVNNRRKNNQTGQYEDDPAYVDCVYFDQRGTMQWIVPHLKKGFKVVVSGRMHTSRWEDKNGQQRSKLELHVNDIDANWPKKQGGYQPQTAGYAQSQQAYQQQQYQQQPVTQVPHQTITQQVPQQGQQGGVYDDNIPF